MDINFHSNVSIFRTFFLVTGKPWHATLQNHQDVMGNTQCWLNGLMDVAVNFEWWYKKLKQLSLKGVLDSP